MAAAAIRSTTAGSKGQVGHSGHVGYLGHVGQLGCVGQLEKMENGKWKGENEKP